MPTKPLKNIIKIAAAACILALLSAFAPVKVSSQAAPASSVPGSTFEQRMAQRKAERNVALDDKSQKRIIAQCVKAQGKVRTLQQKTSPALTNRAKVNQQMDAKLWVMIGKLKIAQKDTFNLEKQRIALAEKAAAFQATSKLYQQTIDDLVVVNCQADPTGFKTLLDTARIYRGQLRDQSTEIRNYVINDIKLALSAFAADLQVKPATEESRQ